MNKSEVMFQGVKLPVYQCNTLVIGSGAASLNAAWHLSAFGVKDVIMVTENLAGGTSNNSGSDKQTYYKLALFGEGEDSVYSMARTLFNGGAMHGDIALVEATLSAQEFYHLVQIGVPFPYNEFGGYVGYKTDHDPKQRATSAGPWTSNQMHQKLLEQVKNVGIPILDQHEVISLLTSYDGNQRVIGALGIDKTKADAGSGSLVVFQAENVIMGTGGPGGIYAASVYPEEHLGSTGIALKAGAKAANLTEWQYGLASIKFRWNVSGTYQQVIPRYVSTKQDGTDARDFLNDYFPSMSKLATAIFLKGYQWPFDIRKIENYGSSLVDVLVYQETVRKGRRVFMDFRTNPQGRKNMGNFCFEDLDEEAYSYLEKSGALFGTPIERLQHMNPMAIELYGENGIDLRNEPLEIAVCAQHNNGGLVGDMWWESNVKHLFPIGEANGSHGVYRPGGSALNSGQVGGYRAAEYIANVYQEASFDQDEFLAIADEQVGRTLHLINKFTKKTRQIPTTSTMRSDLQQRMTKVAAHIRDLDLVKQAISETQGQYEKICRGEVIVETGDDLIRYFQNRQLCFTQLAVLKSIEAYIERGGGSRGSYVVVDAKGKQIDGLSDEFKYRPENEDLRSFILEYQCLGGVETLTWEPVREIPDDDFWFENVWRTYVRKGLY